MALEAYPKQQAFRSEPTARSVLDFLIENQKELGLENAVVFCNFPLFKEEGEVLSVKLVMVCPLHGVVLVATHEGTATDHQYTVRSLEGTFSQVFSRLVKYPRLRKTRTTLAAGLDAFLFLAEEIPTLGNDTDVIVGFPALSQRLEDLRSDEPLSKEVQAELISVLDGSKALLRQPERNTADFGPKAKVAQISQLEEEIRRFDRDQRIAYMTEVNGTQRVRVTCPGIFGPITS